MFVLGGSIFGPSVHPCTTLKANIGSYPYMYTSYIPAVLPTKKREIIFLSLVSILVKYVEVPELRLSENCLLMYSIFSF